MNKPTLWEQNKKLRITEIDEKTNEQQKKIHGKDTILNYDNESPITFVRYEKGQ